MYWQSKALRVLLFVVLICGLVSCGQQGGSRAGRRENQGEQNRPEHGVVSQAERDAVRRMDAAKHDLDEGKRRLLAMQATVMNEEKVLETITRMARTAYEAGLMEDFRTWHQIGIEKRANILNNITLLEQKKRELINRTREEINRLRNNGKHMDCWQVTELGEVLMELESDCSDFNELLKERISAQLWIANTPIASQPVRGYYSEMSWLE